MKTELKNAPKESLYNFAKDYILVADEGKNAESEYEYAASKCEEAANIFKSILHYKDSATLAKECRALAKECHKKAKTAYYEKIYNRAKESMSSKAKDAMSSASTEREYEKAASIYKEAANIFKSISAYKDSAALAKECFVQATEKEAEINRTIARLQAPIKAEIDELEHKANRAKKSLDTASTRRFIVGTFLPTILLWRYLSMWSLSFTWLFGLSYGVVFYLIDSKRMLKQNEKIDTLKEELNRVAKKVRDEKAEAFDGYSAEKADFALAKRNEEKLKNAKIGDYITFGRYEQDNNASNGKEDIEWLVLDIQDGKALVISKNALNAKPYHTERADVTWETCTLRT